MKNVLSKTLKKKTITDRVSELDRGSEEEKEINSTNSMDKGIQIGKRGPTEAEFDEVAKQINVIDQNTVWQKVKIKRKKENTAEDKPTGIGRQGNMEEKTQSDDAIEMSEAESDREGLTVQNNKEKGIDSNNRAVGEKDNVVCNNEDTIQGNKKNGQKRDIWES